jgi:hypothetical protein
MRDRAGGTLSINASSISRAPPPTTFPTSTANMPSQANACARRRVPNLERSIARTFSSVNEAWKELRHSRKGDHKQNSAGRRHGYDPSQPRVPKGHSEAGQWTQSPHGDSTAPILSDVTPENEWTPGAQYAQGLDSRGRGGGPIRIGNNWFTPEPGQAARLTMAHAWQQNAIGRVREIEPNWRPKPSAHENVEGLIRTYEGEARQAETRLAELASVGVCPGPFAAGSIPARGPERNFTTLERGDVNRIGYESGCHTCGTRDPGSWYSLRQLYSRPSAAKCFESPGPRPTSVSSLSNLQLAARRMDQ